jgi:hypothetical protein
MKDSFIVALVLIASIIIGGVLYLFGPNVFHELPMSAGQTVTPGGVAYETLAQGQDAREDMRVNYRIMNSNELSQLWAMVYGQTGPSVPAVDFTKNEVLGIFDGSHSSGGYSVSVQDISDKNGQRTVTVLRTSPGPNCATTGKITSPFIILSVPKTSLPLTHVDVSATGSC